jgi:hypothetical protein
MKLDKSLQTDVPVVPLMLAKGPWNFRPRAILSDNQN